MKICIFTPFDINEATSKRASYIATELEKKGYDITFLATKRLKGPRPDVNFKLVEMPPRTGTKQFDWVASSIPKSLFILEKKFDIIHAFKTLPLAAIPSLAAKKLKCEKFILDWDDWEGYEGLGKYNPPILREFLTLFERKIPFYTDGMSVCSKFLKEWLIERGYERPISYVPNGVPVQKFKGSRKVKLPNNSVIFSGTLSRTSDLGFILPAVAAASKKIDLNLIVMGEGERQKEFEEKVRRLGIEKSVRFVGWKEGEERNSIIRSADIALMPFEDNIQNRARSAVKLAEYMALGCAIVANSVGEGKNMLDGAGLLVGQSKESMANAIVKLLENSSLRNSLKKRAKRRAKIFDWNFLIKDIERLYEQTLTF